MWSWDVYAAVLGEEESNLGIHNHSIQVERLPSGDRVGSLEDKNLSGSPRGKSGQDKPLLVSPIDVNQFQVRELFDDYPSSDANSIGGASMISESTFYDEVAVHSPLSPYATKREWIVYS